MDDDQDNDEDNRRNVQTPEIGQHATDRPQRRLGCPPKKFADRVHNLVARIDHIEGYELGEDGRRDQDVNIKVYQQDDAADDRGEHCGHEVHLFSRAFGGRALAALLNSAG